MGSERENAGAMCDLGFRRAARLVVIDDEKRVLLLQYEDHRGAWWATPGGGARPAESVAEAAAREAREELGLEGVAFTPLWEATIEYVAHGRTIRQHESFFRVDLPPGAAIASGEAQRSEHRREGIRAFRFWSIDALTASRERIFPEDLADRLRSTLER